MLVLITQTSRPVRAAGPWYVAPGGQAGCKDLLGNLLNTDQRGVPRFGGCDIGSYEVNSANNALFHAYIPALFYNRCRDFFDDFANPASGWAIVNNNLVRSEYLNGEFRVLSKQTGYINFFSAPSCDRENYTVEVDARWVGSPGSSYGLIFGVTDGFNEFYLFDMNTDFQQFRLLHYGPGGYTTIVPITDSPAINGGNASNHLKVSRDGSQISLEINGTPLGAWSDNTITGLTGAGVVAGPYNNNPTSDVRFDNSSMATLSGATAVQKGNSSANELSGSDMLPPTHVAWPASYE
jgi:hypothetical protein